LGVDSVGEIGQQMPPLLATGCARGEDFRHEAVPVGAVRPEATLALQDGGAQGAFGGVIGWLDPRDSYKFSC
jgi:hypothetical protein